VPENGGDTERYYAFTYGSSRFLVLDSNAYSFALTDQTAWIERELIAARQDSTIRHIFVVMHHPPFSISLHGGAARPSAIGFNNTQDIHAIAKRQQQANRVQLIARRALYESNQMVRHPGFQNP